jgi:chorismate mutase/prephenate dehydratase
MTDAKAELTRIQEALGAADDALADAFEARCKATLDLAAWKTEHPDAYFVAPRESAVFERVVGRAPHVPEPAMRRVVRETVSACAHLLAPIEIVYVGQDGGFGNLAARSHFGNAARLRPTATAADALSEVERGHASFAIVPFETSYDGAVTETLNLLARSDLKICAEIPIRRAFHLLSRGGERAAIKKIYAAASAITACQAFLATRLPGVLVIDVPNGVEAARHAWEEPGAAALATEIVAAQSGLDYVERSIEDVADLETRYVAVGNDFPPRTGADRTAIALVTHDAPGVLVACLKPFADRNLNLYRLETRPARGWEWRYLILLELEGHITDRAVLAATEELRGASRYVKVLGSYPRVAET